MQLGRRWQVFTPSPTTLPTEVADALTHVEGGLREASHSTSGWYWTLTYLEGRPVVQLADGTTVRVSRDGDVSITLED
jgi:hypothetical protein